MNEVMKWMKSKKLPNFPAARLIVFQFSLFVFGSAYHIHPSRIRTYIRSKREA